MYKEKYILIIIVFIVCSINTGCGKNISLEKEGNINFTLVQQGDIPEELQKLIAQKREEKFHLSYKDNGEMYICVGYGRQETGGYSGKVKEVYLTKNGICIDITIIEPPENNLVLKSPSYP